MQIEATQLLSLGEIETFPSCSAILISTICDLFTRPTIEVFYIYIGAPCCTIINPVHACPVSSVSLKSIAALQVRRCVDTGIADIGSFAQLDYCRAVTCQAGAEYADLQ